MVPLVRSVLPADDVVRDPDKPGHRYGSTSRLDGGTLTYWAALDAVHDLYKSSSAAIPVSETGERQPWHSLRHTFGTECAARGVPITTLQELIGHEDIETTRRYVTVTRKHRHEAIALAFGQQVGNSSSEQP